MSALQGIRIIELAEDVSGEYCGKLLADFGAEVLKVERPTTGSPTRSMAPRLGGGDGPERSGLFAYLNTNKKSVVLDLGTDAGVAELHELIAGAAAVIDDHDEDWLSRLGLAADEVERVHPGVVFCSITPFGQGAPADWRSAKSLNVLHASGWGYHVPTSPDPDRPPLKGPGRFLVDYDAGLDAALCVVASLFWRNRSHAGQLIDVSRQEVMVSRADCVLGRMLVGEDGVGKERSRYDQSGPHGSFPCADGAIYLYMTSTKHWKGLCELMGNPSWAAELRDDWLEFAATSDAVAKCCAGFADWVRDKNKHEVSAAAQRLGMPLVPVQDAVDVYRSEQYIHRGFFQTARHPVLGEGAYPTVPYKLSASPAKIASAAPLLGEHTAEILGRTGDAAQVASRDRGSSQVQASSKAEADASKGGPLAGVRVLEMTKVWAGPYAGKLLAFLGAEVIKVESWTNLDEMRAYGGVDPDHAPFFLSVNPGVKSVQVNLKCAEGIELLKSLVANSDVVLNNLRPGAMERAGLGYEQLRAIKRDIISVSIKMFGNEGPLGYQTGYAPCFAALGGLNHLVGYEGEPPSGMNMRYGDSTVGAHAAFAACVALLHRDRTGEGQFVDVSAVECMSSMVGDCLFEYAMTGHVPGPDGNRHADMAPHGAYRCRNDDWLSLAVASDAQWRTLCEVLGATALAADSRYATLQGRQTHADPLDAALSAITQSQDAETLAARCRAAGIAAFKSRTSVDIVQDPWLWERHFFTHVPDHRNGSRPILGRPWRMSRASEPIASGAPKLGEHNREIYCDVLGMSQDRLQALIEQRVVY